MTSTRNRGHAIDGVPHVRLKTNGTFLVDLYLKNPLTGKRERRVTRTFDSLPEALQWRDQMQARNTLSQLPVRPGERVTLGRMIALKLNSIREIASYKDSERILITIGRDFGQDRPLEHIDEAAIGAWLEQLGKRRGRLTRKPLANKTLWNHFQHLMGLFRMAHRKGWIQALPELRFKKRFGKRRMTITLETFLAALDHLPGAPEPDKGLAMMALFTGQRLGNLRTMIWDQIDGSKIRYQSSKTNVDGLMIRKAPTELLDELNRLRVYAVNDWLFANPRSGKPFSPNAIRRHLEIACDAAGVPRFTPHQIRHQATTTGLELSGDPDLVEKWIGWLSPEMIRTTYGHLGNRTDILMDRFEAKIEAIRAEQQTRRQTPSSDGEFGPNIVNFPVVRSRK